MRLNKQRLAELEAKDEPITIGAGGRLIYRFPPASVTRLQLTLT